MCWALVRVLFHLPNKVTNTNIRRWEWKGDQQKKNANTTTTNENLTIFCDSFNFLTKHSDDNTLAFGENP
jgi:hypothetical protein